jgi:uncharacterized tellurite resistance protein B-like protein
MLPVKEQISLLVRLSKADRNIAESERELIFAAGERLGLTPDEVNELIEAPVEITNLKNLPSEERFDYLYMVIQLMKADKKVFQSEIQFCERVAMRLGYRPGVVGDLSAYIYSDPNLTTNFDHLRAIAEKQILHRGTE